MHRYHPYDAKRGSSRLFVELVDRTYPGVNWRNEWLCDVSFRWTIGTLNDVRVWKARSRLDRLDAMLNSIYLSGEDAFRDNVIAMVRETLGRRTNAGGGNCFYLAASFALFGDERAAAALRKLSAIYRVRRLELSDEGACRAEFAEFLKPTTWAEDHAIQGLACALRCDFSFVDVTQPKHAFAAVRYASVCSSHGSALVRVTLWSHSATTSETEGHFESFDTTQHHSF